MAQQQSSGRVRHLIVFGRPGDRSFSRALAEGYEKTVVQLGHSAVVRDLYALNFDPRLSEIECGFPPATELPAEIATEVELVREADIVVLVYPVWFGLPPAVIKGYVDRVFGSGFLSGRFAPGAGHSVMAGKRLHLVSTSASTRPWLEEAGQWTSSRWLIDRYLRGVFGCAGVEHLHLDGIQPGLSQRVFDESIATLREWIKSKEASLSISRPTTPHASATTNSH